MWRIIVNVSEQATKRQSSVPGVEKSCGGSQNSDDLFVLAPWRALQLRTVASSTNFTLMKVGIVCVQVFNKSQVGTARFQLEKQSSFHIVGLPGARCRQFISVIHEIKLLQTTTITRSKITYRLHWLWFHNIIYEYKLVDRTS